MLELWKIVKDFDFSDEIGRRNLHKLIKDILIDANLSYNNVLLMVKILEQLYPSIEERTEQLTDIISEIRNPLIKQQLPDCIIRQQKVEVNNKLGNVYLLFQKRYFIYSDRQISSRIKYSS